MSEPVIHIAMFANAEDESEATMVLEDLMAHLNARLEYWGYDSPKYHSPVTLLGEIL